MPIYECSCESCGITFEVLAPVSEANRKRPCPQCVRPARRVVSSFAIGAAGAADRESLAAPAASSPGTAAHAHHGHTHPGNGNSGRRGRPPVPDFARLCWMDDRSAERFAAYKLGRGAEYDDKSAAKEELRKQRGLPAPAPDQSNSPVARMVTRKKADQAKKAAKAAKAAAPGAPPQ